MTFFTFNPQYVFVLQNNDILVGNSTILKKYSPSGTMVSTFATNLPLGFNIQAVTQQKNTNKILVGGYYPTGGPSAKILYRLDLTTGLIDTSFNVGNIGAQQTLNGTPVSGAEIDAIETFANGDIIITGNFTLYNGYERKSLAKLNADGSLNTTFNFSEIYFANNKDIAIDTNNNVLVGGAMDTNTLGNKKLIRLNGTTGAYDTGFLFSQPIGLINSIAVQSNGKILIGGQFESIGTYSIPYLARLNADGTVDTCFNTGTGPDSHIENVILTANQDIYIKGRIMESYNGIARDYVARLKGNSSIVANDDTGISVNGYVGGTSVTNVLVNDSINGVLATTSNVTLTQVSTTNSNVHLGSNGAVIVDPQTSMGTYTLVYRICSGGACLCDEATVTVTVTAPSISAVSDTFNVTSCVSTSATSVLANDSYNGSTASTTTVLISWTSSPLTPGFTKSGGVVTVGPSVPSGSYTFNYKITDKLNSTNFATATLTINVTRPIDAVPDTETVYSGVESIIDILENDTFKCAAATTLTVTPTITSPSTMPDGFSFNNGIITVGISAVPGTYTFTYKICETAATVTNCDTAEVTITVEQAVLVAVQDDFSLNCLNGLAGATGNDLTANDTLNGQAVNDNNITITLDSNGGVSGLTINSQGLITIPSNSPYGTYVIYYTICQTGTQNCSQATATICINNGLNPGDGANNDVFAVVVLPDGDILIGGAFTAYNNIPRNRIARLNPDLSLDTSFDPSGVGFNDVVYSLALDSSNRILVGGRFTATGAGVGRKALARLNSVGSLDVSLANINFEIDSSVQPSGPAIVNCIAVLSDGNIIVGGNFDHVNSSPAFSKTKIVKLTSAGAVVTGFNSIVTDYRGTVSDIYVLGTQSLFIGGHCIINSNVRTMLYKVNLTTGLIDGQFQPGIYSTGSLEAVYSIRFNANKILAGGSFSGYNSSSAKKIVQVNLMTGVVDNSSVFNPGIGADDDINTIAIDNFGKILIGGLFSSFNNNNAVRIARLNTNGSFDASFSTSDLLESSNGINSAAVFVIKVQPDNKIVVGGSFQDYGSQQLFNARNITRIVPGNPSPQGRPLGLDDVEQTSSAIKIYPNPSTGIFNIDFVGYDQEKFELTIHNTLGQLIYNGTVTPQDTNQIDLGDFESGNYFIRLQNANETINRIVTKK